MRPLCCEDKCLWFSSGEHRQGPTGPVGRTTDACDSDVQTAVKPTGAKVRQSTVLIEVTEVLWRCSHRAPMK